MASRLAAEGCTTFFVATVAEGIALRDVIDLPELYVLDGVSDVEAPRAAEYDLVPVINSDAQLEAWRPYRSRPIAVHVDTGMNRLGFSPADAHPQRFEHFELAMLMTHLACAEEPQHPRNAMQLERFTEIAARFPGVATSIANSAGILLGPQYRGDVCRPGVALYGASPFDEPLTAARDRRDARGAHPAVTPRAGVRAGRLRRDRNRRHGTTDRDDRRRLCGWCAARTVGARLRSGASAPACRSLAAYRWI